MLGTRIGLALLVVVLAAGTALADLASGRDKYVGGDYKGAKAELEKVTGKDRPAARLLLARTQLAVGDHAGAEATLAPLAAGKDAQAAEARIVLAELRRLTGRVADARRDLEQLYRERPDDRAVRTALGRPRLAPGGSR
jgi:thioredoxin-like negative regulator of GroEL